jgi:hypothetical protein
MRVLGAIVVLTFSASSHSGGSCSLSPERLVQIAKEASPTVCQAPKECKVVVNDRPSTMCEVSIWPETRDSNGVEQVPIPGNFHVIVISNEGAVVKRVGAHR